LRGGAKGGGPTNNQHHSSDSTHTPPIHRHLELPITPTHHTQPKDARVKLFEQTVAELGRALGHDVMSLPAAGRPWVA